MRLRKQLVVLLLVVGVLFGTLALFSMDIIKLEWVGFMEIQPSFDAQEDPLPVPARSIPVDGPAFIPNVGAPENPIPADDVSISRGQTLFTVITSYSIHYTKLYEKRETDQSERTAKVKGTG